MFLLLTANMVFAAEPARDALPKNNYPTLARIEYVNNCMARTADKLAGMYQCSCAIDKIADSLKYEEFEHVYTISKYAGLPGELAGEFRDEDGRKLAKKYHDLESDALRSCGMKS
jgi:hypothetical protein